MFDWAAHANDDVRNVETRRGTATYELSELVSAIMREEQAWNGALNNARVNDADSFCEVERHAAAKHRGQTECEHDNPAGTIHDKARAGIMAV